MGLGHHLVRELKLPVPAGTEVRLVGLQEVVAVLHSCQVPLPEDRPQLANRLHLGTRSETQ